MKNYTLLITLLVSSLVQANITDSVSNFYQKGTDLYNKYGKDIVQQYIGETPKQEPAPTPQQPKQTAPTDLANDILKNMGMTPPTAQ